MARNTLKRNRLASLSLKGLKPVQTVHSIMHVRNDYVCIMPRGTIRYCISLETHSSMCVSTEHIQGLQISGQKYATTRTNRDMFDFSTLQFVESYSAVHSVNMAIVFMCSITRVVSYCALSEYTLNQSPVSASNNDIDEHRDFR